MRRFLQKNGIFFIPVLIFVVVLALSIGLPASVQPERTEMDTQRTITVGGTGQASGSPDIAYIQVGTDQAGSDPSVAFYNASSVMNAVRDAVMVLDIAPEDIQTTTINMWVQDSYDDNGNPTGDRTYHAQNSVQVMVHDVTKAGEVIDAAIIAGADTISDLSFGIADTSSLTDQAQDLAIKDAQAQAAQIADSLGVMVGDVITVSETVSSADQPVPIAMDAVRGANTPVSQGQLSVSVQVTITFAISS